MNSSHHKRDSYFLAIDQGGHASRTMLYDSGGRLLESCFYEIETFEKDGNVVEHDALAFIESVHKAVQDLSVKTNIDISKITAAGLACQRSSIVCWERSTGKPLSPIVSWQDRRTADELSRYALHEELIRKRTGLLLNPHYGASKMRWCLEHMPELEEAIGRNELVISPVASFLLFHLLEQKPIVIDPANAGRTLLYDYQKGDWCDELLSAFDIERRFLPQCVPTKFQFGSLCLEGYSIPFQVCTGDQSAAIFAAGRPDPHSLYVNAGTGVFIQQISRDLFEEKNDGLLKSIVFVDEKERLFAKEGTVNGGARALQWYEEKTGFRDYLKYLEAWLSQVDTPPVFINSISGMGSPFWTTIESRFDRECAAEEGFVAVFESILFLIQCNIRLFNDYDRIFVGGGLSNSEHFCQYLADLSGVVVIRQEISEATSRGLFILLSGSRPPEQKEQTYLPGTNEGLMRHFALWEKQLYTLLARSEV